MHELVAELREHLAAVRLGGGESARRRHLGRGKLLVARPGRPAARPRLAVPGARRRWPRYGMYDDAVPSGRHRHRRSAGSSGRECVIVANDATVKGGTYYPITVKKHLRAQEIARENRLPCIYLVDSGGAFLPMQDEVFPDRDHFGRIFFNQAQMSAAGHPAARRRAWARARRAAPTCRRCPTRR